MLLLLFIEVLLTHKHPTEPARGIQAGNFLHKTAVLSGLAFFGLSATRLPFKSLVLPIGVVSLLCATVYDVSASQDSLLHYQVRVCVCV